MRAITKGTFSIGPKGNEKILGIGGRKENTLGTYGESGLGYVVFGFAVVLADIKRYDWNRF